MKGTDQTKSDILEAFWRLYAQKPLDKITIRELTEVAGYNRGTFYLHYQDIYDLFESEKSRLLAEMEECVAYCSGNMGKIELIKLMMHVLALYERNRTQIVLLLGERGDPAFMKKLRGMMKQIPLWKAADPNLKASTGERDLRCVCQTQEHQQNRKQNDLGDRVQQVEHGGEQTIKRPGTSAYQSYRHGKHRSDSHGSHHTIRAHHEIGHERMNIGGKHRERRARRGESRRMQRDRCRPPTDKYERNGEQITADLPQSRRGQKASRS